SSAKNEISLRSEAVSDAEARSEIAVACVPERGTKRRKRQIRGIAGISPRGEQRPVRGSRRATQFPSKTIRQSESGTKLPAVLCVERSSAGPKTRRAIFRGEKERLSIGQEVLHVVHKVLNQRLKWPKIRRNLPIVRAKFDLVRAERHSHVVGKIQLSRPVPRIGSRRIERRVERNEVQRCGFRVREARP